MNKLEEIYNEIRNNFPQRNVQERFMSELKQSLEEVLSEIPAQTKVALRANADIAEDVAGFLESRQIEVVGIYDKNIAGGGGISHTVLPADQIDNSGAELIIVLSFVYRHEICEELKHTGITVWDLYDKLEKKLQIELMFPFSEYKKDGYQIFLTYKNAVGRVQNETKKADYLDFLISAAYEIKEFWAALSYMSVYVENGWTNAQLYKELTEQVKYLLNSMKEILETKQKTPRDIIMFWIDGLSYSALESLPLLSSLGAQGIFFEKAYPCTPYTHSTMRCLLAKWLPIDDAQYTKNPMNETNSELLAYLQKKNYGFNYIGAMGGKCIDSKYIREKGIDEGACCNLWDAVELLADAKQPMFIMIHMLVETHIPYLSPALTKVCHRLYEEEAEREKQLESNYLYIDRLLWNYNEIFGDRIKIYMSDHGRFCGYKTFYWDERRLRATFFILGKNIPAHREKKIFSYIRFMELVKYFFGEEKFENVVSDYGIFQDTDVYSPKLLSKFANRQYYLCSMSYRGVVTMTDKYVRLRNGNEYYFENNEECDAEPERLEQLRKLAGNDYIDINDAKFAAAKELFEKYEEN